MDEENISDDVEDMMIEYVSSLSERRKGVEA